MRGRCIHAAGLAALITIGLAIAVTPGFSAGQAHADPHPMFLPMPLADCSPERPEAKLGQSLREHPEQQRPFILCERRLEVLARKRARQLADMHEITHRDPERRGPNKQLYLAGYPLSEHYPMGPNNLVEAIAGGPLEPEDLVERFARSAAHRAHVLGEGKLHGFQRYYGVGHYHDPDSLYRDFWVVLITSQSGPEPPFKSCIGAGQVMCY